MQKATFSIRSMQTTFNEKKYSVNEVRLLEKTLELNLIWLKLIKRDFVPFKMYRELI